MESPSHTSPLPPSDGRVLVVNPANPVASPFGWHDTNGAAGAESTLTQGNNVLAYTDIDANNTADANSSPNGGTALNFDLPLKSINGATPPHGVGQVWAQAAWEVYWKLVDKWGFDPNLL